MREIPITLGGSEYPLCFTLRAAEEFQGRYGEIDGWFAALLALTRQEETDAATGETRVVVEGDQSKLMAETLWLLDVLLRAGWHRAKAEKRDAAPPPDAEALKDLVCVGDIPYIRDMVLQATAAGNQREVGVQAPKNGGGAGQGAEPAPES